MKKKLLLSTFTVLLISCSAKREIPLSLETREMNSFEKNIFEINQIQSNINDTTTDKSIISTRGMNKINLQDELAILFNPDNFVCNCDEKLKKKLKKLKSINGNEIGFIPDIVAKQIPTKDAYLLGGSGSCILANGFSYKNSNGEKSILLYARNSPTVKDFNESKYMEIKENTYNNFFYTLDCSGYLSAAVTATAGVNSNSIKSSATAAALSNNSLVVISGLMNSPLYQAYKGEGEFFNGDELQLDERIKTFKNRINVLKAILNEIPLQDQLDDNVILISSNYLVVIASNSGTSSFNGKVNLDVSGGIGYGIGSFSGEGSGKSTVNRKSNFSNYKTYTIDDNIGSIPHHITVLDIKTLINSITTKLNEIKT